VDDSIQPDRHNAARPSPNAAEALVHHAFEAVRLEGWRLALIEQRNDELTFELSHHLSATARCTVRVLGSTAEASRSLERFFDNEEFAIVRSAPAMRHSLAAGAFRRLCFTRRWSPQVFALYLHALHQLSVLDVEEVEWLNCVGPADFGDFGRRWRALAG
jgi:hypothetical protein